MHARRRRLVIALDIGATAVKLLELGGSKRRLSVASCAIAPLPPEAVVDRRIADINTVGSAIRQALRHCGSRTRDAVLAIPEPAVIRKVVSIPAVTDATELESQVELAATRHMPFPIEQLHFDFQVLGPAHGHPQHIDVLLVAAHNTAVAARIAVCELGGLHPRVIDTELDALAHAATLLADGFADDGRGKTIAVIDTGAGQTLLTVLHDMATIYTHSQPVGDLRITHTARRRCGQADTVPSRCERLGRHLNHMLDHFLTSTGGRPLDQVVLSGGGANTADIAPWLQARIDVPVSLANPLHGLLTGRRVNRRALMPHGPALMLACGLALRRFD